MRKPGPSLGSLKPVSEDEVLEELSCRVKCLVLALFVCLGPCPLVPDCGLESGACGSAWPPVKISVFPVITGKALFFEYYLDIYKAPVLEF